VRAMVVDGQNGIVGMKFLRSHHGHVTNEWFLAFDVHCEGRTGYLGVASM